MIVDMVNDSTLLYNGIVMFTFRHRSEGLMDYLFYCLLLLTLLLELKSPCLGLVSGGFDKLDSVKLLASIDALMGD